MNWKDRYKGKSKDIEDRRGQAPPHRPPQPLPRPTSPAGDYATDWDAVNWMQSTLKKKSKHDLKPEPEPKPLPAPRRKR